MNWKFMNKDEAETIFNSWGDIPSEPKGLSESYLQIKDDLTHIFKQIPEKLELEEDEYHKIPNYLKDLLFGLELYDYLNNQYSLSERIAADTDFWRYLSMKPLSQLVYLRWGKHESRFYKVERRIWLKTIWWYIHLSWQGSVEKTYDILKENTTDEIAQLVERVGDKGYRKDLYREIMKIFGELDKEKKGRNVNLFRRVMKLNTAKVTKMEPGLHKEGVEGYARELFSYFGIK